MRCINIIHTRVWCELLNRNDFIVSGKAHSGVIFSSFISFLYSTSSLSLLPCKTPQSSLCFPDHFQTYYLPLHKEYGYNDMACIVSLPAVQAFKNKRCSSNIVGLKPSLLIGKVNHSFEGKLKTIPIIHRGISALLLIYQTINHGLPNRLHTFNLQSSQDSVV